MLLPPTEADAFETPPVEKVPMDAPVTVEVMLPEFDWPLKIAAVASFPGVPLSAVSVRLLVATLPKPEAWTELPERLPMRR